MLGQKGFFIQQRDFALLRIKNELFISRAGKDTCVCSTINPRELFMFSFFHCLLPLNSVIDSASLNSSYKLRFCQKPQLESLGGMINNSLPKLELLTIGQAVTGQEFRESHGCLKIDGTNTLNFVMLIFDRFGKNKKSLFVLNWRISIFWRNYTSFFDSLCIMRICIILLPAAFMGKLFLVTEF